MSELTIAKGLTLPLDAVTRAAAIVGQRGTGKTSTAVVFVEEAAGAGAHFAVVDPTGAWYGLTSNAKGTGPGLDCVVMGGHNGDVPLEAESGALVARLVVEERYSVVLDLELMTKAKQIQFVAEFAEELYHRNRSALTLVVDEAHRFAPQGSTNQERGGYGARCLGAVTDVATLGRRKGLGAVLISQRPAKINKDVFEECEVVIAHRLMGNNDRKQIAGWLEDTDEEAAEEARQALSKLRKLKQGHALVYAPTMDVYGDFLIRRKRTFDSSATPEVGGEVVLPKKRAEVDLAALEQRMAETLERQKADDPKELKQQIARLQKELRDRPTEPVETVKEVPVEVPVLDDAARGLLEGLSEEIHEDGEQLRTVVQELVAPVTERLDQVADTIGTALAKLNGHQASAAAKRPAPAPPKPRSAAAPAPPAPAADGEFSPSGPQQRILDALAMLEAIGVAAANKTQLALFAEASPKSSSYTNNLGALRTAGLIAYPVKSTVALTDAGRGLADSQRAPDTAEEIQAYVRNLVSGPQARIVDALLEVYPDALTKEDLAERAGASAGSSSYTNNLGALRSLGLIDYPTPGWAAAQPVLFLETV